MVMRIERIEVGSLLSYSPHGFGKRAEYSRDVMSAIKNDQYVQVDRKRMQMSEYVAKLVGQERRNLPFSHIFDGNPILVPTPSSSLKKPDSLWPASRIAVSLSKELGNEVARCLVRIKPLPKSATSAAADRSTAAQHFESLEVQKVLNHPKSILLVDDVVTRGATLLGAANRLVQGYPEAHFAAFTALRTVSNPSDFNSWKDPVREVITLQPNGGTLRRPWRSA